MNKIIIQNLECFGKHGAIKEENILGQKFIVSAKMEIAKPQNDELSSSVNYAEVCKYITKYVSENIFKLIETLADNLAINILKNFSVNKIKLRVEKPFAPIGLPLDTVAAEVERKWSVAYLSIGSNMGDKKGYLDMCINELRANAAVRVSKVSDYITTKAYGYTEQEDFLNAAVEISTLLTPWELLDFTSKTENKADRKREIHWGPRTLDIDILLYEDFKCFSQDLIIPHIDMHNREFVLKPLCQIAPYAVHNAFNKSILELYMNLQKNM